MRETKKKEKWVIKEKKKYPHNFVKYRLRRCEVIPYGIVKFCASHKMKLSVPLTSADTSRCEASLHCGSNFTYPQAHIVQKPSCKMQDGFYVSFRHYRCHPQDKDSTGQVLQKTNISFASFDKYPDLLYWWHFTQSLSYSPMEYKRLF